MGLNFTLETGVGPLDLLGEVTGGGSYEDLLAHTIEIEVFGIRCRCLDLPRSFGPSVRRAAPRTWKPLQSSKSSGRSKRAEGVRLLDHSH